MSATWDLVCTDCLVAFPLGKRVDTAEDGSRTETRWGGFRNGWDGRWIGEPELNAAIAVFLLLHISHTLAVLETDLLLELLEDFPVETSPFNWVASVEDLEVPSGLSLGQSTPGHAAALLRSRLSDEVE